MIRRRTLDAIQRQHQRELERRDARIDKLVDQLASLAGHTLPHTGDVWEGPSALAGPEFLDEDLAQLSDDELATLNPLSMGAP